MKNIQLVQKLSSKLARPALQIRKNSPAILFAAGVIGVGATVVLACRATLKAGDILDDHKVMGELIEEKAEKDSLSEVEKQRMHGALLLKTSGKLVKIYGPSAVVFLASVGALSGAQFVLNKRIAGLGAAYAAVHQAFEKYRSNVVAELGEEKDLEFRHGAEDSERSVVDGDGNITTKVVRQPADGMPSMYARIFDENNRNWSRDPVHNQVFIQCQQNYANDMLRVRGHVLLNDVYDMLGFDRTSAGAVVGWVMEGPGDRKIDFGVLEGDRWSGQRFINGQERSVVLDFNVAGVIYDLIDKNNN